MHKRKDNLDKFLISKERNKQNLSEEPNQILDDTVNKLNKTINIKKFKYSKDFSNIKNINNKSKDKNNEDNTNSYAQIKLKDLEDIDVEKEYLMKKSDLKNLFIEQIFIQKLTSHNYELSWSLFNLIEVDPYGNCFYISISFFLYNYPNEYLSVRDLVF